MANKFIVAAMAALPEASPAVLKVDPVLGKNRPALCAFMADTDAGDGEVRELSALMVQMSPEGVRVGLREPSIDGWCWRVGETLADALDALEEALVSGKPVFSNSKHRQGKKRR